MILNGARLESIRKILEEQTVLLRLLTERLGSDDLDELHKQEKLALRRIIDRQRKALEEHAEEEPAGLPRRTTWQRP